MIRFSAILATLVLISWTPFASADDLQDAGKKANQILSGEGTSAVPVIQEAGPVVGPNAAYEFYAETLGGPRDNQASLTPAGYEIYPNAKPISLTACKNITQLRVPTKTDKGLWTRAQIEAHYLAYKNQLAQTDPAAADKLKGIIVMLKTEYCCRGSRLCAASTSVLEKQGEKSLQNFKVYGYNIHPEIAAMTSFQNSRRKSTREFGQARAKLHGSRTSDEQKKEKELIAEFGFVQGPGARWVAFTPGVKKTFGTDAQSLQLGVGSFGQTYKGASYTDAKVRPVEKWASDVLAAFDDAKSPKKPVN